MIDGLFGLEQTVQKAIIWTLVGLLVLAAIVAGGLGIALWMERKALASCQEDVGKLRANLAIEKANTDGLRKAITAQGDAVKALGTESDKRVAESKAAAERARKDADRHFTNAQGLLGRTLPAGADACVEANVMVSRWLTAR